MTVPLHPERVAGRPDQLRWVTPPASIGFLGAVHQAPGALGGLLREGVLTEVLVEPAAVLTTLAVDCSWREAGATVRTALHAALEDPSGWQPAASGRTLDADAALASLAADLFSGPVGDVVRAHGGGVDVVDVRDGVVSVRLSGACQGCPALSFTLSLRLEQHLRAAYPGLQGLRAVA